jgi:hypothetical protein
MTIRSEAAGTAEPAPGSGRRRLTGGCHCGNLALTFEPARDPAGLAVRACGCAFCRGHGARTVSDPQGRVAFLVRDQARLSRYRFGLGTAEFLVCRTCGVYVGAVMTEAGSACATVNINALQTPEVFPGAAVPVSYDRESASARRARRRARWTPATVVEAAAVCEAGAGLPAAGGERPAVTGTAGAAGCVRRRVR